MILHGNQRGGAKAMGLHLLNSQDNEHVSVHEVKGFMALDLMGALRETEALSKGTKCRQYLYSCSFNPPQGVDASIADFEDAFDRAEEVLGLTGQPRVVVFHEKHGRRHAHVVWSRIDSEKMKAINLPHTKRKLTALGRELFLEHGWELPRGLQHLGGASPENFTMAQWQQAQRTGLHPTEIKKALQTAWSQSDDLKSFAAAIREQGYRLAKGDRRGFVFVDLYGEVYSVAKWLGVKTKDVKLKLGTSEALPSVDAATAELKGKVSERLLQLIEQAKQKQVEALLPLKAEQRDLTHLHISERMALSTLHRERHEAETASRMARFNKGWRGLWDRLTGRAAKLRSENEEEAALCKRRDRMELDEMVTKHLRERRTLEAKITVLTERHMEERKRLFGMVADYLGSSQKARALEREREAGMQFSLSL
ncbi:relaxase/mobilization nuclease domain-containing protein [Oceaniradius stylonematis]|uniref:relaxase/mobilization nuclease domain-containing protein n=1 Tax=Oceaniradius stylonematis TaxID=2184161 RepID=UPI00273FDD23|nr:relaxase/mobilization nuclease domain-containing protein [Oceaniradius stylonematis]